MDGREPGLPLWLGVVAQQNTLWDRLSCRAHLRLFARLRGVPAPRVRALVEAVLVQMELTPYAAKLSKNLSGGMKRKLCVAIALIGDPQARRARVRPNRFLARPSPADLPLATPAPFPRVAEASFHNLRNTTVTATIHG